MKRGALVFAAGIAALAWAVGPRASARVPAARSVDVGPRAATAPEGATRVRTFDELRDAIAAPAGPTDIWLEAGTYRGDLEIKRPVAIRGDGRAVLEGTGASTVVTIGASDVTLANVHVRHSGRKSTTEDAGVHATGERVRLVDVDVSDTLFGILLRACHSCAIERAHVDGAADATELRGDAIKLWESHDSTVRGSLVERSRDVVVWYTRRAVVENNVVRESRYGTHFMYAHDSVARGNRFERNVVGVFVMYSQRLTLEDNVLGGARGAAGMGVGFKESDAITLRRNWFVANTTGAYLDFTPRTPDQPVLFEANVFALDDVALRMHSIERGAVFHGNDFRGNDATIEVDGGGDALGCEIRGNHFDEYEGYDLDHDGRGDVPHRVTALSRELADEHPALKLLHGTTAMHLVDAVAHAVPILESHALLEDPSPLVGAPEITSP